MKRFLQFCAVGLCGTGVNLAVVQVFLRLLSGPLQAPVSSFLGIVISIFTNFLLNDSWTWADRGRERSLLSRVGRYYLGNAVAAAITFGIAVGLHYGPGVDVRIGQAIGIGVGTGVNYTINHFWTFGRDPEG